MRWRSVGASLVRGLGRPRVEAQLLSDFACLVRKLPLLSVKVCSGLGFRRLGGSIEWYCLASYLKWSLGSCGNPNWWKAIDVDTKKWHR